MRAELDKRWGEVGRINAAIGRSHEYLNKVCRGELPIKLDVLLQTLDVMAIDAGRFFANALATRVANDSLLEDIERFGEIDGRLKRIEKATVQIELLEPPHQVLPEIDNAEAMLAMIIACKGTEQRRRLGTAQKYRHPAFAAAYLEHLDDLRYDNPREARQNVEAVAVKLIPRLAGPNSQRIALQLKAIGIFASTHRQKGDFATAARALRLALSVARRHHLRRMTADLLLRSVCVVSDHARYGDALVLLDEALAIYFDLDCQIGLGSVMVERATTLCYLGKYQAAIEAVEKSLRLLQDDSKRTKRNRLVAYRVLAFAYRELRDLERAEIALAAAIGEFEQAGCVNWAGLLWDRGATALAREAYDLAEESLREASEVFGQLEDPNRALVVLDLTEALMGQSKVLEATAVALTMAEYLTVFRGNRVAEAAISELIQTAVEGKLTLSGLERVRTGLQSKHNGVVRKAPG